MRIGLNCLLVAVGAMVLSASAFAEIGISVGIAPPELLSYQQPICPGDGYLWTPGYWGWDSSYYWVPGEWVMPPEAGYLWTPGYWGWGGDGFMFNEGYWGLSVGFYGGIDYGFGYFGQGYRGGRWNHGHFFYNSSVNNLNRSEVHNVYNQRVNERITNHISYNGGTGGITARATANEETAGRNRHIAPVAAQAEHAQSARVDPKQRFTENHAAATRNENAHSAPVHPKDLPALEHPASPNTGNAGLDQKYQKQQDRLTAKQDQDRQKLQQQQDNEHRQFAKQQANAEKTQQLEQRHSQQTQQMEQRHSQQTQQMGERQSMGGGSRGGGERGGGGRR